MVNVTGQLTEIMSSAEFECVKSPSSCHKWSRTSSVFGQRRSGTLLVSAPAPLGSCPSTAQIPDYNDDHKLTLKDENWQMSGLTENVTLVVPNGRETTV